MSNAKFEDRCCQFYAYSKKYEKRMIFSFRVTNENDAIACLRRFKAASGWYVVRDKKTLKVLTNRRIYSN